ncbi:hypothetical protein BDV93DRAFT_607105 [Ceratobasidium sp. AG-I]|nr:hypothetical protein BDV93DRAFT_607105 [Ceratobasidium sp. AG-I]
MATYPGFLNSSYVPQEFEMNVINNPGGMLGSWLLATVFCLMMEGVVLCQVCAIQPLLSPVKSLRAPSARWQTLAYTLTFTNDAWMIRSLVYVTTTLCTLKAGHMIYISWDFFVDHFGNYLVAATNSTSTKITVLESSIIGAIVQSFFIHRVFLLSRNWVVLALTVPTLILGLAGALSFTILSFTERGPPRGGFSMNQAAYMMVSCVVACDVFITGFTCWTGFSATNSVISRLLTTAIQSAAPPTICAILNLYFNSQAMSNAVVNTFNSLMPFFYVSSMIFALNARSSISRGGTGVSSTGGNAYELRSGMSKQPPTSSRNHETTWPEVYISRQTHVDAKSISDERDDISGPEYDKADQSTQPTSMHKVITFQPDDENDSASYHRKSLSTI